MEQNLEPLRHSLAHLLGAAVEELYPGVRRTIGPAIDNGFYYDFDFSASAKAPGADDLPAIEAKMKEILPSWKTFERTEVTPDEAKKKFADNKYKIELIDEFSTSGDKLTFYTSGTFTDLCRGGHSEGLNTIDPGSFKLHKLAGSYWRGDEKRDQLTRIYGLAFSSKAELEAYLTMLEEAKARDHRKLGVELDLFTFSPLVGAGLPLWTPKGTILREELNAFVWELRKAHGYERVTIPHITKRDLYETSGHWQKFTNELFKISTREGKEYALKPMNCPHHTQIFAHLPRSYRDMPQRYAETTMVYRDEQSGELGGLTRVLSITQDDAHVFCRHSQIEGEFNAIWNIIDTFYRTFGFELRVRLSFHDGKEPQKYLGTPEIWAKAEATLEAIAKAHGTEYFVAPGEAAMYGPKLDFMAKDSLGREHQVATIQLDMNLPERFDLSCVNEEGKNERIVMIHCAVMGSIERFSAVLIEHLAGLFPVWLSPVQVMIVPIAERHGEYAESVRAKLIGAGMRAQILPATETLGKRVREAEMQKTPFVLVVGDKEAEAGAVAIRTRGSKESVTKPLEEFLETTRVAVKNRER